MEASRRPPFTSLVADIQIEIAANFLDAASRASLALTCHSLYKMFKNFTKNKYELLGRVFFLNCVRFGYASLARFCLDELKMQKINSEYAFLSR